MFLKVNQSKKRNKISTQCFPETWLDRWQNNEPLSVSLSFIKFAPSDSLRAQHVCKYLSNGTWKIFKRKHAGIQGNTQTLSEVKVWWWILCSNISSDSYKFNEITFGALCGFFLVFIAVCEFSILKHLVFGIRKKRWWIFGSVIRCGSRLFHLGSAFSSILAAIMLFHWSRKAVKPLYAPLVTSVSNRLEFW